MITLGISLGVLLEMEELLHDTFSKSKGQHGLKDTNFDLIANIIGAILAGLISSFIFQ